MTILELHGERYDELTDQPCPMTEVPPIGLHPDATLMRRLARAKTRLDRLERDADCRDHAGLASARVAFTLAARALADELICRGLDAPEDDD